MTLYVELLVIVFVPKMSSIFISTLPYICRHNCKPTLQNPKILGKYRNKVLHYYNLLRGPKEEDAEHPDIVKFRRSYNHCLPFSLSALKQEANSDFRPNVRLSPSLEEQKNFLDPRIQSSVNQEFKSCYFTPLASLENCVDSANLFRVRNQEQNGVCFERNCPSIDDLIKYNTTLVDDASFLRKPSKFHRHLPYLPKINCSVAGTGINAEKSSDFPYFQPGYSQNSSDIPEDNFFARREASVTSNYTSSDSTIDGSSFAANKGLLATDSQHTSHQCSSNSPENNRLSRSPAFAFDSGTLSNIGNDNEIQMNSSPPRITDLELSCCQFSPKSWKTNLVNGDLASVLDGCSSVDRGNVANFANTSSPPIEGSKDNFYQCAPDFPEHDSQTRSPTTFTRSHCETNNFNSSSLHCTENGTPYIKCVEGSTSLYKYFHVPEKCSVTGNKASASGKKKTNAPFYLDAPVQDGKTEVEFNENAITDEFSQASDKNSESVDLSDSLGENPTAAKFPSSSDSFMEEISFSPDEDSDADVPQNTILNVRVVVASPYKIFSDSSCSSSPILDF